MKTVDCRNMACPAPVITTKKTLEEADGQMATILVDEGAARENVSRFLNNRGYSFTETPLDNGFSLKISGLNEPGKAKAVPAPMNGGKVVLVTSDKIGDGPEELGKLLMKNFIITLLELPDLPYRMIFLNTAIHLTTDGSEVLEPLKKLDEMGVEILSCGLCLDFFHKKEKLMAGKVTNMYNSAESLLGADSVIHL